MIFMKSSGVFSSFSSFDFVWGEVLSNEKND